MARGTTSAEVQEKNVADASISISGDWAQDESLVGLLAQNPFFNDDNVRVHICSLTLTDLLVIEIRS